MFYVIYGLDDSDKFLVAWSENKCWIMEYASTLRYEADLDWVIYEYSCTAADQLAYEVCEEVLGNGHLKNYESINMHKVLYLPFRNIDDYILITQYDYGCMYGWMNEMIDSFAWEITNSTIMSLYILVKFLDPDYKVLIKECITNIYRIVYCIVDKCLNGNYDEIVKLLDWPALCKYFSPSFKGQCHRHVVDIFHLDELDKRITTNKSYRRNFTDSINDKHKGGTTQ